MKPFLDKNFLLDNQTSEDLYHGYAKDMPIIDYHNHLSPQLIAEDPCFENLTQAWLYGDHYKWRGMRWHGVNEKYCTGDAGDWEKFEQWAAAVPFMIRNPLFHWTHLELRRYFGVNEVLSPSNARKIYELGTEKLRTREYSVRNLLRMMKVEVVCTTDDPTDSLEFHDSIAKGGFEIKVYPSFRPDKAMAVDHVPAFNEYVNKLEAVSGMNAGTYDQYLDLLKSRHDHFANMGCRATDHGLNEMYAEDYTDSEIREIFITLRKGGDVGEVEKRKFKSAILHIIAVWNHEKDWVQQYHLGPLRNNNSRMLKQLGPDTGWDSMGGSVNIKEVGNFLDRLDRNNCLTRTVLYSINAYDNEVLATMAGNFNDGSFPGKIQSGAPWWFNDQKTGIQQHIDSISNMGLLSKFIGMLTDSRSFLSFPRHEYFRRILCNMLGKEMESGELPNDLPWIGGIVQDICYNNTKHYLKF
jgi:glucuronate isomerase